MSVNILLELDPPLATITLNRPQQRNAISYQMWGELSQLLRELDDDGNCRAVVEAQMISMRIHSEWMGVRPTRIYATGGASANREILQIMADVQGCPVCRSDVSNSAALGAALRAAHGFFKWIREP